ncbi:MAG: hypothetical protein IIC88_05480 [Chloroflexi bacterium]|nr:hypothetical protein [Chloroflexota bacterium]
MVRAPLLLACFLATLLAAAPNHTARAEQLLANGGFEDGVSGWQATGGWWSQAPGLGVGGSAAGALTIDPGPSARGYQPLSTLPGGSYQLSGRLLAFDGDVQWAQLSLALRDDGGSPDRRSAGQLFAPGSWSAAIAVPCGMVVVGVEVLVGGAAGASVYLDDLRLERLASESCAPAAPIPTATALPPAPTMPTATVPPPAPAPLPTATAPPAAPAPLPTATAPLPTATMPAPAAGPVPTATAPPDATATVAAIPFATTASPAPSHGLLLNGGFESEEAGGLVGWRSFGGLLTQVDAPVRSGRFAARFASATFATKWIYQTVAVAPAEWYELDGYVYMGEPGVAHVLLRISWYASADASGSALATVDSTMRLEEPASRYRYLTTGPVQSPEGAHSAKARILLRPASADSAVIYIDDVTFRPATRGLTESGDDAASSAAELSRGAAVGRSSVRSLADRTSAEVSSASQADGTVSSTQSNASLPTPVLQRRAQTPAQSETAGDDSTVVVAGAATALVAGAIALGGAAWYARRRWRR